MRNNRFNIKKTSKASVSIMLSFMMLPVYSFGTAVVDGVKISSARTMTECAADMAAEAGLSDFDSVLQSVYGLFAVSSTEDELRKNLSDYFYRTVNNTALTEQDEAGRKYISGIADFFSDPSGADFDNLMKLNTESVDAAFTDGAVLANPEVLKSQITDYMKYTGPLKMSSGILNKLDVFKDFKNQNKAVNAKIDYDKSLERINGLCRDIWKNASAYNKFLSEGTFHGASGISDFGNSVRNLYKDAVAGMLMYRSLAGADISSCYDSASETYLRDLANDAGVRTFDAAADMLDRYISAEDGSDSAFTSSLKNILNHQDSFGRVQLVIQKNSELSRIRTFADVYFREYDGLSDDEKNARKSQLDRVRELTSLADSVISDGRNTRESWKNSAEAKCRESADIIAEYCKGADTAIEYLENTRDSLESLLEAVKSAEKAGEKWQNAVSALAEGEVKASMQNEYDKGVKGLSVKDISDYLDISVKNLEAFRALRSCAEELKFHGISVYGYFDYYNRYSSLISSADVSSSASAYSSAVQETTAFLVSGTSYNGEQYSEQGDGYDFYRYLYEIYGKNPPAETDRKSAADFLNTMNSLGSPDRLLQDIPDNLKSDILSNISKEKLDKIKNYSSLPDNNAGFSAEKPSGNAGSTLEGQQKILRSAEDFFEKAGRLSSASAGEGIENLLVTEYIMQMFSCYTSEKEYKDGKTVAAAPSMLSGVVMDSSNNVFYRSEAEYILWGNENMEKNLSNTRALIFGTRFAFNSIYAFTDDEIRTVTLAAATAISGWTGFGIPVVKTVLVLSLALAESVIDTEQLLAGDAVPVYKNSSTWNMKPSGIINAVTNNSDELVKAATVKAGRKVEDIFSKIDEAADGGTDKLTETVNGYIDQFAAQSADAAVNTINNVVFAAASEIIENSEKTFTKENISQIISDKIKTVSPEGTDPESRITAELQKLALKASDEIASVVYECCRKASGGTAQKLQEAEKEVAERTEAIVYSLRDSAKGAVSEIGRTIKESASQGISSAGECAGEYARDFVGNMASGVTTELTEKFGGVQSAASSRAPSPACAVTLTYKEYLRIFLLLNILSENREREMLARTAVLIDINMNNGMKNVSPDGKKLSPKKKFDITDAHTMVTVDAVTSVNTWIPGIFIPDSGSSGDNPVKDSGTGITERKKNISFRTVMSY